MKLAILQQQMMRFQRFRQHRPHPFILLFHASVVQVAKWGRRQRVRVMDMTRAVFRVQGEQQKLEQDSESESAPEHGKSSSGSAMAAGAGSDLVDPMDVQAIQEQQRALQVRMLRQAGACMRHFGVEL